MWKKVLIGLLIGAGLLAFNSVGYATNTTNPTKIEEKTEDKIEQKVDLTKYQVTNPEEHAYSTGDKVAFIHGKAPAGTSITIQIYGTTDLTRKNFNLLKLPGDDDYIEVFTEVIKSGNMGLFDKQLDLVTGINKIIIKFDEEGVPPKEIIVFVKTQENAKTPKNVKFTEKLLNMILLPK